ncbi:MAG: hypothetical protein ABI589_14630, partial [Burkholderiales bacterium]
MPATPSNPLIATRAAPAKKAQFAALAARQRLTESALLTLLIDKVLDQNPQPAAPGDPDRGTSDSDPPATDRITLRLRPGDRERLEARADARSMKLSS